MQTGSVAALDLSLMTTVLVSGGVLLWRRRAWGWVLAAIAAVQSSLYLLVLTVNSDVAIRPGFAAAPGEVPLGGTLTALTTAAALMLLRNVDDGQARARPVPR
jgi:hypothetical protein